LTVNTLFENIFGVDTMMNFSDKITTLRKQNAITQKQLSLDLNLSERNYQRLEAGGTTPTVDTVLKLCRYYNISADYLLSLTDEPRPLE